MDVGLTVEFDGKKNIVMSGVGVKEYPIGGMICEYARLRPTEVKQFIMDSPYFHDSDLKANGGKALYHLYETMKEKLDVVTAIMVLTDICNCLTDLNLANDDELRRQLEFYNEEKDNAKVKKFILEDTGFNEFGTDTIGQAMLTAYMGFAQSYVTFKHSFNILVSKDGYKEDHVSKFIELYISHTEFQHIDFHIALYENGFHSVYTIKSSLSLILFEAAHAIDGRTKFVKCKNCGNYFVPVGRSDSVYCGYPSPQDETKECRDVGANATRARKMKNDVLTQEYRRLYMRLKMAIKRHPNNETFHEQFQTLTEGMKEKRRQKSDGEISTDDILEWLSSFDDRISKD